MCRIVVTVMLIALFNMKLSAYKTSKHIIPNSMIKNEPHNHFIAAHSISTHPVTEKRFTLRANYYFALEHFVTQSTCCSKFTEVRLRQYRDKLIGNDFETYKVKNIDSSIHSIVNNMFKPWRRNYRYWLLCDFALILLEEYAIQNAFELLKCYLSKRQRVALDKLLKILLANEDASNAVGFAKALIEQFHKNRNFIKTPEKRLIVTANMSAGKSTLINAIVGKPVTRTSQEACTANLCHLYNKPFDDGAVHRSTSRITLNATHEDLMEKDKLDKSCIASYFNLTVPSFSRICLIDTPGVNSALHRNHGDFTRKALSGEQYDILIYVFNASRLGTDEEQRYLKYISKNVPKEKIIFVINKLDDYRGVDDSIEASLEGVRNDLRQLGYDNPKICPISAYFALLLKMKQAGLELTEDELEAYELFAKKFAKPKYDLSRHYTQKIDANIATENNFLFLSAKCGLYGLENVLFGAYSPYTTSWCVGP